MSEMNENFLIEGEGENATDNPQTDADPGTADPAANQEQEGAQGNDTDLLDVLDDEPGEPDGQGETPPAGTGLEDLKRTVREVQSFNTKLLETMETIRKENEELKQLLSGEDPATEPDPEADKPLTKRELMELLTSPDIVSQLEQSQRTIAQQKWQENMANKIRTLQEMGIVEPGSRVATFMDEYFTEHGEELIGDPDAVKKALHYAKKKLKTSPPAARKQTPPPSGGKTKGSSQKEPFTGEGLEAFKF